MIPRKYDYPLADWICAGLHKDKLESVVNAIGRNMPIEHNFAAAKSNKRYIDKIMREEAIKQFSDTKRPILEVVLNAIDARPRNYGDNEYKIKVNFGSSKCCTKDNGRGMNLSEILRFLIIPFSTEKKGIEEIGRFGVGFLSTFNYCLGSGGGKVTVDTSTGKENYSVTFYSSDGSVEGLRMKVRKSLPRPRGTSVKIRTGDYTYDKDRMLSYLYDHINGIPPYVAKLSLNNHMINSDSHNKWYSAPVTLSIPGKKIEQQVGIKPDMKHPEINLTSQGVLVLHYTRNLEGGATIAFPSAVKVVEGRDEFKIDENYRAAVDGVFKAIEGYALDVSRKGDSEQITKVVNFIPSLMSAFSLKQIKKIPNIESIAKILLDGKKYVMMDRQFNELSPFFGDYIAKNAFVASPTAFNYWRELFGSERDMMKEVLVPEQSVTGYEFRKKFRNNPKYPNLYILAKQKCIGENYASVNLVNLPTGGKNCMLFDKRASRIYINTAHRNVSGQPSHNKVYAILSEFMHSKENASANSTRIGSPTNEEMEEKVRENIDSFEIMKSKSK